jgi:hypothetical protein
MTKDQVEAIEAAMLEEHRKDLEALQRLKRFLPNAGPSGLDAARAPKPNVAEEEPEDETSPSLRDKIAEILSADPSQGWTTRKVLARLVELKFPLGAQRPINGVSVALSVWVRRGKAYIARRGTGRKPHIYRWGTKPSQAALVPSIKEAPSRTA